MLAYNVISISDCISGNYRDFVLNNEIFPDGDTTDFDNIVIIRSDYKFIMFRDVHYRIRHFDENTESVIVLENNGLRRQVGLLLQVWINDPYKRAVKKNGKKAK